MWRVTTCYRRLGQEHVVGLLIKNLLFTVLVPGTVAVYIPLWMSENDTPASDLGLASAMIVLTVGATVYGWCVWNFAASGRGTPAPIDAPKKLVIRGLYNYTRNPMYLGVLTVILGWIILFRTTQLVVYNLAVATLFHLFVVVFEEPRLKRRFGVEYEEYCARVPRWLPGLRR